jgi:hypothetical protein
MTSRSPIQLNPPWEDVLKELCTSAKHADSIVARRVVAVVGPKNVGKSTFARELLQRWQGPEFQDQAIAFLDTDLGRPEFTLPGLISLHIYDRESGAMKLEGALYLGEDDPSLRPQTYIEATRKLGALANKKATRIVVNTHGWFSGLGQDVLEAVLLGAEATDVVQIVPEAKMAQLGSLLRPSHAFTVWTLAPAKEGRQRESRSSLARRIAEPFTDCSSVYAVGLNKVKIKFPAGLLDRTVPARVALLALNATIVGLTTGEDEEEPTAFAGVGLVLAVDADRQLMFLQSPLSPELIAKVTCLKVSSTARLALHSLPSQYRPEGNAATLSDFQESTQPDLFLPYRSQCKLVGFGSHPQFRSVLKRRRFDAKPG